MIGCMNCEQALPAQDRDIGIVTWNREFEGFMVLHKGACDDDGDKWTDVSDLLGYRPIEDHNLFDRDTAKRVASGSGTERSDDAAAFYLGRMVECAKWTSSVEDAVLVEALAALLARLGRPDLLTPALAWMRKFEAAAVRP